MFLAIIIDTTIAPFVGAGLNRVAEITFVID